MAGPLLAGTALCGLGSVPAAAASTLWTGAVSGDWSVAGNWSAGAPTGADIANIYTNTPSVSTIGTGVSGAVDEFFVGAAAGVTGSLIVTGGGTLSTNWGTIGWSPSGVGVVTMDGAGTQLDAVNGLSVGHGGPGSLNVLFGAVATSGVGTVGYLAGSDGSAVVGGSGAQWNMTGALRVGFGGMGDLTVNGGGAVSALTVSAGGDATGTGTIRVDGSGSILQSTNTVYIGQDGTAAVTVVNGGALTSSAGIVIGQNVGSTGALNIGAAVGSPAAAAGTVSASGIVLQLGTAAINFNHTDTAYTFAAPISSLDSSPVINQIAGTTILTGDNSGFAGTTTVTGGTLVVNSALNGIVNVDGGTLKGGGSLLGFGGFNINSGGTLAPGNSIGTLNVAGDITFNAGSIYAVEVDDAGNADLVHAGLTATIDNGASVHVRPENGTDTGITYADGITYTIITADGGVTGTFGSISDAFVFLNGTLAYDANNVYLTLNKVAGFASVATTPNQIAAANGAEGQGAGDPVYDVVLGLTASDAVAAFDALSGEGHASLKGVLTENSAVVRDAVLGRLEGVFAAPDATGAAMGYAGDALLSPESAYGGGVWGNLYGGLGNLASDGNAARADFANGGIVLGVDGVLGAWRLGVAATAGMTGISIPDRATRGSSTDYGAALYGGTQWGDTGFAFGAAYTRHAVSTTRDVVFPGFTDTLNASYGAATGQVFGELNHEFDLGSTAFTPFAQVAYVNHATDAFTEQGGAAALSSAASVVDGTFTTLGLRASQQFVVNGDGLGTLRGGLAWRHAFADLPVAMNSFAGGTGFTVSGAPIAADALVLEAGLDLDLANGMNLALSYDAQIAAAGQSHVLKAGVGGQF